MNYSIGILVVCVAVLCGDFSPKREFSWRSCCWGEGNEKNHNELDAGGKTARHYRDTVSGESAEKSPCLTLYGSPRGVRQRTRPGTSKNTRISATKCYSRSDSRSKLTSCLSALEFSPRRRLFASKFGI